MLVSFNPFRLDIIDHLVVSHSRLRGREVEPRLKRLLMLPGFRYSTTSEIFSQPTFNFTTPLYQGDGLFFRLGDIDHLVVSHSRPRGPEVEPRLKRLSMLPGFRYSTTPEIFSQPTYNICHTHFYIKVFFRLDIIDHLVAPHSRP